MEITKQFAGDFETHITVELSDSDINLFCEICEKIGVKPVFIQLPNGKFPSQPMTACDSKGTLDSVLKAAQKLVIQLTDHGFKCIRVKIEASPFNEDLPQNFIETAKLPDTMYFEYHVKVLLDDTQNQIAREICGEFGAHLSQNVFKIRDNGLTEKFITLRMYGFGLLEARSRVEQLMLAIQKCELKTLKSVLEYCVYDTNTAIDEDWFDI